MIIKKRGFTLIEVLISIMLLSLVLMALYKSAEILRASNRNLFNHLDKTTDIIKGAKTLYMDILQSDGNITISSDRKFDRVEILNTKHSLYGLSSVKVAWLVYKEKNQLLRVEGGDYTLPLKEEDNVAIDIIAENIEIFHIYMSKKRKESLVILKTINQQDAQSFMVQGLSIEHYEPKLVSPAMIHSNNSKKIKKK